MTTMDLTGSESTLEFGIMSRANGIHRSGLSEREARSWYASWLQVDGRPDAYTIVARTVVRTAWQDVA